MIKSKGWFLGLVLWALPLVASAAGGIVVQEVNWAGSVSSAVDEWLELANTGSTDVDLAGWTLWNTVGEPKEQIRIERGIVPAGGTYLIANNGPDATFSGGPSSLAVVPDVVASGLSLSNSTLRLELRNAAGEVVEVVGNGSKPFAGSSSAPFASMERIMGQPGDGSDPGRWQAATATQGFDAGIVQFGTPTNSGRIDPVLTPPTPTEAVEPAPPLVSLEAVVRRSVDGTVRIRGQVLVPEALYKDRTLVVGDGEWSIELSLPEQFSPMPNRGDRIEVVGKVSTGSMPKLLVQTDQAVVVIAARDSWSPLELSGLPAPRLLQLVRLRGAATPVRGSVEVRVGNRTAKVTRRQGVSFPPIAANDTVTVTGLVVAEEPLTVRVLEEEMVEVVPVEEPESSSETQIAVEEAHEVDGTTAQSAAPLDESAVALEEITEVDPPSEGVAAVLPAEDAASLPVSAVLGVSDRRRFDPMSVASLTVAVGSLCVILMLLGDWVWLYLKTKQGR